MLRTMNWAEVCEHPSLKDLPFKIELNEHGNIIMSPVKFDHSLYQGRIIKLFARLIDTGEAIPECAIHTRKGTKVADVAWVSDERLEQLRHQTEAPIAPEICVEVLSTSNTEAEIQEKRELYFEHGAEEIWICEESGDMYFYTRTGQLERSRLMPDFPDNIAG